MAVATQQHSPGLEATVRLWWSPPPVRFEAPLGLFTPQDSVLTILVSRSSWCCASVLFGGSVYSRMLLLLKFALRVSLAFLFAL